MLKLSDPIKIGSLEVKNRFVMAPMVRNMATKEGLITDEVINHYEECAKGQVGLIIVEAATIAWEHAMMSKNIGVHDDKCIPGLRKLAEAINKHGTKSFIQINHSGLKGLKKERYVGPSDIPVLKNTIAEPISVEEIEAVKQEFVDATRRAKEAGFDGVEIHGAHYYLLSEFLSSYTNRRDDEYGGSTKNKTKFSVDIIKMIREELGDYPLIFRMNGFENVVNGVTMEEGIEIAKIIEKAGIDCLHISCVVDATYNPGIPPYFEQGGEPDFLKGYPYDSCIPVAGQIKPHVKLPVIGVGEVRDKTLVTKFEEENVCDMLAIGRGLLADPYFVQKILEGREDKIIPWKD
ncbi:MAG: NADH:flavin oxidoreductase [Candidatus Thorarchaeota archaeon]